MANVKELDQKRIVGIVFKALLIDLLAFTIILPLFPRLLNYYQSEEVGQQVRSSNSNSSSSSILGIITISLLGNYSWLCFTGFGPIQVSDCHQQTYVSQGWICR